MTTVDLNIAIATASIPVLIDDLRDPDDFEIDYRCAGTLKLTRCRIRVLVGLDDQAPTIIEQTVRRIAKRHAPAIRPDLSGWINSGGATYIVSAKWGAS